MVLRRWLAVIIYDKPPIYYLVLYATLTRKHGRAIDVAIIFPCEEQEQGDEHEHT